ncbi:hypothetical protein pb186bvf_002341 [Paramecium bursaria]
MKKVSIEQSQDIQDSINDDHYLSKQPSSQELDYETQSFTSKEDPFQNERGSTGKLIKRNSTFQNNQGQFQFLKGQQIIIRTNAARFKYSTTHLLGLQQRAITPDDQLLPVRAKMKNFQLNLQADQGFIKQFREYTKQLKPSTSLGSAFLTTTRDQFYKEKLTPGPGIYDQPYINKNPIQFTKSPQISKSIENNCNKDFYDFKPVDRHPYVPDFEHTIGRDEAYQKSIFAQIEIQKRSGKIKQKDEEFDEKKIDREIEYLRQYLQKYGQPYNYQKHMELSLQTKKLQLPESMHHQWSKMLDGYGFRKHRGKLIKQKQQ